MKYNLFIVLIFFLYLFQGFYLYLYTVSIVFVVFHYANLMRQKAVNSIINEYGK